MNIREYIASGILEDYAMGALSDEDQSAVYQLSLLHPKIAAALLEIEKTLEQYANLRAVNPDGRLKQRILNSLDVAPEPPAFDLGNLPVTNSEANHLQWLQALKHLIPEEPTEDFMAESLRSEPHLAQTLVITKCDVPEETHGNVIESFFILKGECICAVGNNTFHLHAGSFLEIPLHVPHTIQIVSPYVVGILQHRTLEI
jgi:mannose-6-phosphate isomerase-like protein (cupin superfamily)